MLRGLHHNSRADEQKYCALCEESMESLVVLVHTVGINFRCGGKLDLTSEGGHLGFFQNGRHQITFLKMSASNWSTVLISVSKPIFSGSKNPMGSNSRTYSSYASCFFYYYFLTFKSLLGWDNLHGNKF